MIIEPNRKRKDSFPDKDSVKSHELFVLVMICMFVHWTEDFPLRQTTSTVAKVFLEVVIPIWGTPLELWGTHLTGQVLWQAFLLSIKSVLLPLPCQDLHVVWDGCRPQTAVLFWSWINKSLLEKYLAVFLFQVNISLCASMCTADGFVIVAKFFQWAEYGSLCVVNFLFYFFKEIIYHEFILIFLVQI